MVDVVLSKQDVLQGEPDREILRSTVAQMSRYNLQVFGDIGARGSLSLLLAVMSYSNVTYSEKSRERGSHSKHAQHNNPRQKMFTK
jgi:hypothetical protein